MALSIHTTFPRVQSADPARSRAPARTRQAPSVLQLRRLWLLRAALVLPMLASLFGFGSHQLGPARFPAPPQEQVARGAILTADGLPLATGPASARSYPLRQAGAALIGFTGAVQPDGRYGLEGLEFSLDPLLTAGQDVTLTIDSTIQAAADRHLAEAAALNGAESGAAVVLEAGTGRILAAASYPSYDPNAWEEAGRRQMTNQAFIENYEPGSVIKPIVIAGLLESGLLRPDEMVETPPTLRVGEQTFRDVTWHEDQLSVADVLAYSSNSGMINLSKRFTNAQLHEWLMRFGIGQDVPVPGTYTESGHLNPWYRWVPQDHASNTIGQNHSTTALQLAAAYSIFANDGLYVAPRLVEGQPTAEPYRILSPEVAHTMRWMLNHVTESSGLRVARVPGVSVAAKTGTADVYDNELGRYVRGDYNLSVAGMVPAEDPRFVAVVMLHKPAEGATSTVATGTLFGALATDIVAAWNEAPQADALATAR